MNKEEQVIMSLRNMLSKMDLLNNFKMKDSLKSYKAFEVHCIEYIGKNADSNVTKLAESFYVTRGAISRMAKKLIKKGIVESYQKPNNKKEIYFRLTEQGKAINKIHEEIHKEFHERDKAIFEQMTKEQFDSMLSFAEKYSKHLDGEIQEVGLDIGNCNKFE
ncbi:DNA-binding transcriptional regulator, MarR family [Clostridium acidisoli DSM 12555]|uniref:DNA-binding transcriptional regulator, MarR family n=1 Tax=Clostridium acidisoli DSM 12555 TaxID=1121291 RepID=A0A1W1XQQ7_9CLOT|nr:MarR family transcriptional regulator [Clostridium acidisoli]SMC26192.1 DNA-binding transcriptional regulator, MarR family [Clostridium acidisoli DSM 12555]